MFSRKQCAVASSQKDIKLSHLYITWWNTLTFSNNKEAIKCEIQSVITMQGGQIM